MADYPAHLAREHRLFDGRTVAIRPARRDDALRMHEFLKGLSGDNLYFRFQKWIGTPPEKLAQYLADVDYDRSMAFVCVTGRRRGLKRMEGLVLATNSAMLRFARGLGFEVVAVPEDRATVRIVKAL